MKNFYTLAFLVFFGFTSTAQTVTVSGACVTNPITLNRLLPDIDGRPVYQGTGTVAGASSVVSIYWMGAPDNLWVVDFDGQPFFFNPCNYPAPPRSTDVNCSWSEVSGTSCSGASAISISGSGTLPVRFTSFTATKVKQQIQLTWQTATEINNKGFEIQRSSNGASWENLGFVAGAGTTTAHQQYQFTDVAPLAGKNYYRLVQYDIDLQTSFSKSIQIDFETAKFYTLYSRGNGLYQLQVIGNKPATINLVDPNGRQLKTEQVGNGVHSINLQSYAKGIYLLRIKQGTTIVTEKIINP